MEKRKTYNASDFERYYSGKMSLSEMHQLEKAALDDPFLGDAFEGYQNTPTPVSDMAELLNRITAKTETKRRTLPLYLKYAAVVVSVIGLTTLFMKLNEKTSETRQESVLARIEQDTIQINNSTAPVLSDSIANASLAKAEQSDIAKQNVNTVQSPSPIIIEPANQAIVMQEEQPVSDERADLNAYKNSEKDLAVNNAGNIYSGRIIDTSGKPVAFASVIVPGAGGVQADENGRFQVPVISNDSVSKLNISATGYRSVTEELKKNEVALIKLEPSEKVVSEVVVTSAFNSKKSSNTKPASYSRVNPDAISNIGGDSTASSPVDGWEKFNEYVYDKLKEGYNPAATDKKKGEVILSFTVDKNGRPTNITVVQSVNEVADAAAIKILQQGPAWKYRAKARKAKIPIPVY